jgi:hypothetical protein
MMLSMAYLFVYEFGLPSIEMWVNRVRIDVVVWAWVGMVEMAGIHQVMWFLMLESTKDRILAVETTGQHVPPHVRYGRAC